MPPSPCGPNRHLSKKGDSKGPSPWRNVLHFKRVAEGIGTQPAYAPKYMPQAG